MVRCKRVLLVLVFIGSFLLLGSMGVSADTPRQAEAAAPLVIELGVQETGEWSLLLGGQDLGLNSSNLASLSQRLGLAIAAPVLEPSMVAQAIQYDVQHLALVKEGSRTTVMVNSKPLTALTIADPALDALSSFVPELEGLIGWANQGDITIVAHFPPKDPEVLYSFSLDDRLPDGPVAEPLNVLAVEATISPQGEPLSVAGMPLPEGAVGPLGIDMSLLEKMGIDRLDVGIQGGSVSLGANQAEWLRLDLDVAGAIDYVAESTNLLAGLPMQDFNRYEAIALDWLETSRFTVAAHIADQSMDAPLLASFGRPVTVALASDNSLSMEGLPLGTVLDDQTAGMIRGLGSVGIKWDGAQNQLRLAAADMALPCLELGDGFLDIINETFMADALPLDMVEPFMSGASMTVAVVAEGNEAPDAALLDYQVQPAVVRAKLVPQMTLASNAIAVYGEPLPLDVVKAISGTDVMGMVNAALGPYTENLETVAFYVGPEGLEFSLNGNSVLLRWDNVSRNNLVDLAFDTAMEQFNLPPVASSQIVRTATRTVVGLATSVQVGVEMEVTDEELPEGFLQAVAHTVFPTK